MKLKTITVLMSTLLLNSLFNTSLLAQSEPQVQPFDEWMEEFRLEAKAKGLSDSTLAALDGLQPRERVLELDGSQPEFVQTFTRYTSLRITDRQVSKGQALLVEHASLLERVRQKYGVQPQYLVSFWALESNYGAATGGFGVLEALLTLAYDPRRADRFRDELFIALQIIEDGHIAPERMTGSWAGAMGQLQFMPATFGNYAVDGDGDGRIDIWNSLPDIFESAANYLSSIGWKGDERWGREVLLPEGFDYSLSGTGSSRAKTVNQWGSLGVKQVSNAALPNASIEGYIVLPSGATGPAFLVYGNYRVTMRWNASTFYAVSVGHLADRFTGGAKIQHMPVDERALSHLEVEEMQALLNGNGFDAGEPDGRVGPMTRGAIRGYQQQAELPMDGYASFDLLESLR